MLPKGRQVTVFTKPDKYILQFKRPGKGTEPKEFVTRVAVSPEATEVLTLLLIEVQNAVKRLTPYEPPKAPKKRKKAKKR